MTDPIIPRKDVSPTDPCVPSYLEALPQGLINMVKQRFARADDPSLRPRTDAKMTGVTPGLDTVLHVQGLQRWFEGVDGRIRALDSASFSVKAGEFLVVQGPSGSGKSTLLNLIGLLDRPSAGQVTLNRCEVSPDSCLDQMATARRSHVGFLFQDAGLIERMSVLKNVMMPMEYRGITGALAIKRAEDALSQVGLSHRQNELSNTLSGGERQRAGIARLLALKPSLIVCDEPTASLDADNSRVVVNLLLAVAKTGVAVVCASHDPIVLQQAQSRISMHRGTCRYARAATGPKSKPGRGGPVFAGIAE